MLTNKQKISFFLLRNGEKVITTALACEVHRCTIWRWFNKRAIQRRYRIYCELDFKRSLHSANSMEMWRKYEVDRDALLKAIKGGNRAAINRMYSYIINKYYAPLEDRIEAKASCK